MHGHEVVLLEASGRTRGQVKAIRDPLADGRCADVGAEHFVQLPAYELYWLRTTTNQAGGGRRPAARSHQRSLATAFLCAAIATALAAFTAATNLA
ncbi:MAG TPA: hypothetical protein VG206_11765 [Terriglobia bacterium]|nr:hypothetical protein [Terriglobia bacterium]